MSSEFDVGNTQDRTKSLSNASSMDSTGCSGTIGGRSFDFVSALLRDWTIPLPVGARGALNAPGWFSLFGAVAGGSARDVTMVKSEEAILFGRIPLNIVEKNQSWGVWLTLFVVELGSRAARDRDWRTA